MSGFFSRVAAAAVSRQGAVIAATVFVALIGAIAALRLETDASTETLVDKGSETFAATEELRERFGDDAIAVLVETDAEHDLRDLVLTDNLGKLLALEGCLAGQAPAAEQEGAPPPAPECSRLASSDAVRVVYGPATFLNQSATQAANFLSEQSQASLAQARAEALKAIRKAQKDGLSDEEARQAGLLAGQAVLGEFQTELLQLAVRYGQTGLPQLNDPRFVSQVVFDTRRGDGQPKSRFGYLFPSSESALISVRLEPDLSGEERAETIELIRGAIADDSFAIEGSNYVVSGVPVVVEELASEFRSEVFVLLIGALAVMAFVLTVVFGPPLRLLPLGIALAATAVTFGVLSLTGGSLTMASIAVLPVLIGLAVDYGIQFQARYRERIADGDPPIGAARSAAARGGPVIATATLASAAGFAVLLLSPIPMVRGFGVLLVVGIFFALVAAMTVGFAALVAGRDVGFRSPKGTRGDQGEPGSKPATGAGRSRLKRIGSLGSRLRLSDIRGGVRSRTAVAGARLAAWRSAGSARLLGLSKRTLALAIAAPGRILAVSLLLAVVGWVASTRTEVTSDLRELVPAGVLERAGVDALQEETGVSGELNVIVTSEDVSDPEVIAWMADLKQRILERGGFGGQFPSCEAAQICPQIALSDLFTEGGGALDQERVDAVLEAVPAYFSQAVITSDPESGGPGDAANIAFGIRVMPLDQQKTLIDAIRAEIAEVPPPAGVEARIAGLPALAADANQQLSDSRYLLTLVGLAAVALVLLAVYRSAGRALVPLVPIALATGWSALVLWAMGIALNPMSATLGALVIAIATEFSVILSARFREERLAGRSVGEALRRTYARTGAAVLASGVTTVAGFAVLILSEIRMLRDFGIVTVVDLGVALVGVMIVLPAVLVLAEGRSPVFAGSGGWRRRLVPARLRRG